MASVELGFVAGGCNRTPANADTSADGELLAYGCGPLVVVSVPAACCALTALRGHAARVNCVRWVPGSDATTRRTLLSASCDHTLRLWRRDSGHGADALGGWAQVQVLQGHNGSVTQLATHTAPSGHAAVACYAASVSADCRLLVWTFAGGDALWDLAHTLAFPPKQQPVCLALTAAGFVGDSGGAAGGGMMVAVGHVDSCIRLYGLGPSCAGKEGIWLCCVLQGHSDWVTSLVASVTDLSGAPATFAFPVPCVAARDGDLTCLLHAGSGMYRLWVLKREVGDGGVAQAKAASTLEVSPGAAGEEVAVLVRRPTEPLNQTVKRHEFSLGGALLSVQLEAVLLGHEDRVHCVRWRRAGADSRGRIEGAAEQERAGDDLYLLSASMDKTMQVWAADEDDGVWTACVRVGDIGGQPGQLGYYGGLFMSVSSAGHGCREDGGGEGLGLLAHGHNGAFFAWRQSVGGASDADGGAGVGVGGLKGSWESVVVGGGHYAPVRDVAWEQRGGHYLVSVSKDQTSRVWGQWTEGRAAEVRASLARARHLAILGPLRPADTFGRYAEVARPQVHGFDLKCLTLVGALAHCYISGADDEKVLRLFNAPTAFVETLRELCGQTAALDVHGASRSTFAAMPALGLSNKPMAGGGPAGAGGADGRSAEGDGDAAMKAGTGGDGEDIEALMDGYGAGMGGEEQVVVTPKTLTCVPTEEELLQHTLWPEMSKLYGHGNACFSLAGANHGGAVAAACRAAESQQGQAVIRIWNAPDWKPVAVLDGHKTTVTQLGFSPDDEYLLSVSRDRSLCVFQCAATAQARPFVLACKVDKAHERIIWSCSWAADSRHFATGSRDKAVKVWGLNERAEGVRCLATMSLDSAVMAVDWAPTITPTLAPASTAACPRPVLAVGCEDGNISLWTAASVDAPTWSPLVSVSGVTAHALPVTRLRWRPPAAAMAEEEVVMQLASSGEDHTVRVWDVRLGF